MPEITVYANRSAFLPYNQPNINDHTSETAEFSNNDKSVLLVGFDIPEAIRYKLLDTVQFFAYSDSWNTSPKVDGLAAGFDVQTASYNNKPTSRYVTHLFNKDGTYNTRTRCWRYSNKIKSTEYAAEGLRNGFSITREIDGWIDTAYSSNKPYIIVTYLDQNAEGLIDSLSPTSGYVAKTKANTFTWSISSSGICIGEVKQTSAAFRWRAGTGGEIHTINCGTAQSVTVPAGTFADDTIQWSIEAALNTGDTVTSEWCTLSTQEALSSAVAISPSGIVIDGTAVNRFSWRHEIATGTAQSKAELQKSDDGSVWAALATVTGSDPYFDVPANTFSAGTKYWRVRTYNTDDAAGSWSDPAEFVAVNAPDVPSVTVQDTGPRPSIAWQAEGQQAYQITLSNGYNSGTVYGTNKDWKAPIYLDDGAYTGRVRVQNQYGLWSDWGSAAIPVSNTQGEAIVLTASAGYEAVLAWTTDGNYDHYIVMRDGIPIGKTEHTSFTDRTSIGWQAYQVRGCYSDSGNYGLSNTVQANVQPETNMICDMERGAWIELKTSEVQLRSNQTQRSATISTVHLQGLEYPVAERSEFRDRTVAVSCAFRTGDVRTGELENLTGKLVCVKTAQGDAATGYIAALKKMGDRMLCRYSFEVRQIYRREEIDIDA